MVETRRIVEWVQRLVQIPSVGPGNAGPRSGAVDEGRIAAQVAAWFEALGGLVEREDVYPGRPNTYGLWRGRTDRWIAVDVHIDTVGVETIIGDPFDGRLDNGRIYGRGAVDTKASLGVVLALLEDMQRRREVLRPNLVVCASSDEETGCGGAPGRVDSRPVSQAVRRPWSLLRRDGLFGLKVVVRPQQEGDAATVDQFGGQPLDDALRGVRLHLAAPQALGAPSLDFLLRRAGRKHFGEAP